MEWVFGPSEHTTLLKQLKDTYAAQQQDFIQTLLESQKGILDDANRQIFRKAIDDCVDNFLYYQTPINLKELQDKIATNKAKIVADKDQFADQKTKITQEWQQIDSNAGTAGSNLIQLINSADLSLNHLTQFNQQINDAITQFFLSLPIPEKDAILAKLQSALIAKLDIQLAQKETEQAQSKLVHLTGQIRKQLEKTPKGFMNSLLDSGIILDDERHKLDQFLAQKAEEYLSSHYSKSELHTMAIGASLHAKAQLEQAEQQSELKDINRQGLVHKHTANIARQLAHVNAPKTKVLPVKPLLIPRQLQNRIEKINEGKQRISSQIKTPLQYSQMPTIKLNMPSTGNLEVKIYDEEGQELTVSKDEFEFLMAQKPPSMDKALLYAIDKSMNLPESKSMDCSDEQCLFRELTDQPITKEVQKQMDPNRLAPPEKIMLHTAKESWLWNDFNGNFRADYNTNTHTWRYKQKNGSVLKGNGSILHNSLDTLPPDEVEDFFKWFEWAQDLNLSRHAILREMN